MTLHSVESYPPVIREKLYELKDSKGKWKRLLTVWNEDANQHIYLATINTQTAEIYLDCRKRKIYAKCLALAVGRPLHTIAKTLYHATGAGIAFEIFKAVQIAKVQKTKIDLKELSVQCLKSMADIVRTPIYGTILTVMTLATLLITPFAPHTLYSMREAMGKVEESMNWGKRKTLSTLAPCFQPSTWLKINLETQGTDEEIDQLASRFISDYPKRVIEERRNHYNPFDRLIGKLGANVRYVSPVYSQIRKVSS